MCPPGTMHAGTLHICRPDDGDSRYSTAAWRFMGCATTMDSAVLFCITNPMTERQIEAGETPCPLTISDWNAKSLK